MPVWARNDTGGWPGLFYCNPDNPAIIVEKRVGLGWTVIPVRPAGWAVLACSILLPVALIVFLETL